MVVLLMVVPWEYLWCLSTKQTSLVLVASMNSWPRPTLNKSECQEIIECIIMIAILYIDACKLGSIYVPFVEYSLNLFATIQ